MKKNIIFGAIAALMLTSCIGDLEQAPMAGNIVNGVYENEASRMSALAKEKVIFLKFPTKSRFLFCLMNKMFCVWI